MVSIRTTLLLALLSSALHSARAEALSEQETAALLAKIAASRAGHAIEADFVEKRTLPLWKEPIVERGTIAFEPPDKFLRKTKNLVVSDGTTLWMYYPEFRQVEKYPLQNGAGPGKLFAALGQALQFQKLAEIFRVSATTLQDGWELELTPKSGTLRRLLSSMTIQLDRALTLKSSVIRGKEGDCIETTYSAEKFLAPGAVDFSFTPPPSASVVAPLDGR